jgi:hypothetical protein
VTAFSSVSILYRGQRLNTIFVPYLNELREWEEIEACEAALFMANCSPEVSNDFVAILTSVRV